jgi:SAM-dependent methyltransferase
MEHRRKAAPILRRRMTALRTYALRLPPVVAHIGLRGMRAAAGVPGFIRYVRDARTYRRLPGAEPLRLRDAFPKVADRVLTAPYDAHYLPQDAWAAQRVAEHSPAHHVDVGSRVELVCFLTVLTRVTFIDIRPLEFELEGLESVAASIVDLPFEDRSLESISCLHVAEHVGLGRYGDPLDPKGTRRAMAELQRILAPGGQLLFSLPVGRPRVCFNAHRIHDPRDIAAAFSELELVEFAGVDDEGRFRRNRQLDELADDAYACGMYRFMRPM